MEFIIRPWQQSDITALVKHANNFNIAKYLTDQFPHPYTTAAGKAFIEFASSEKPVRIFAIEVNQEAAGGIGIHPQADVFKKNAELGYWLAEPYWGKGIITRAVKQIVEYGFANFDIDRIFARPFGSNIGSKKTLEKNGFTLEAKFQNTIFKNGEYQDELIYAVRRER